MSVPLVDRVILALNRLIPKDPDRAVFCSFPDYSDNAYAVYAYMAAHPTQNTPKRLTWLVGDPSRVHPPVGKAVKKHSPRGIWQFCRAKYVFHTHGTFGNRRVEEQVNVSLWHGMPLKTIMDLDATHAGRPPFEFTYTIATSPLFRDVMTRAFRCTPEACLVTGLPRNDLLFDPPPLKEILTEPLPPHDRMVLWMPTYRKGVTGDVRTDGKAPEKGIGFLSPEDLAEVNEFLRQQRTLLLIKVHPMQDLSPFAGLDFSHIRILTRVDLPLYPLVGRADALLTDYSSVYIDYMLLDRPIGFVVDDWEDYRDTRGFVFDDPQSVMPGAFITDKAELYRFLQDVTNGIDPYRGKRQDLLSQFHTHTDGHSTERVLRQIGL